MELAHIDQVEALYAERGGLAYGEGVSQWQHAVQCAMLASAAGAAPGLITAALLHDIGHLLEDEAQALASQTDLRHEILGAQALRRLFDQRVRGPIALHVAAKRYLCFKEPDYQAALSPASTASLALQGGAFSAAEAEAFERLPHAADAVALRRFDDLGKESEPARLRFGDFAPVIAKAMKPA